MGVTARSMLDAKGDDQLIPFLTHGDSQDPEVKDVPRLTEVIKGEENLAVLNAWLYQYKFQRPLMLPPGTPKERLSILRKAFKATLEDPKFLAQAKKSKLIINYVSGEEIERFVDQILAISPKAKERLQFLIHKKKKKKSNVRGSVNPRAYGPQCPTADPEHSVKTGQDASLNSFYGSGGPHRAAAFACK